MKKLITLLFGLLFTITAYSQNGYSSVFLRVTDSATFVNSANTVAKHAAGYAEIWYSVNSGLFWKWSTVTNTYTLLGSGGGWATTGQTNVTNPIIHGGTGLIGLHTEDPGYLYMSVHDGGATDSTYLYIDEDQFVLGDINNFIFTDPGVSMGWQSALPVSISGTTTLDLNVSGATSQVLLNTDVAISANDDILISAGNSGSGHNIELSVPNGDLKINGSAGTSGYVLQSNGAGAAPTWVAPSGGTNTSSALTDGSTITITGPKHTLTSTQATITWTLSQTQDFQTTDIILNATSTTWTFPAGALCVVDGVASGDNTAALTGTSGDHHIMSIYKDGTNYRVAIKNFEQ